MRKLIAAGALALLAAGCSDEPSQREVQDQEVTDLNRVNSDGEAVAKAKALPAGDLTEFTLGGRIGEKTVAMTNAAGSFADLRSFVACPKGMDPCDPKIAPAGTVYTYVMVVYPGGDNDEDTGIGAHNTASDIERATAFRMTMPAHGFTGKAGYAKPEALAAIGPKADVVVSCDAGRIVWTVSAGDGGNQWEQKEPLTFYWQSTLPPAGTAKAYAFDADSTEAIGMGFYPAAREGVANACA
ncbi:hypothetical protein GCM10011515_10020 [Tsuneonella deserti]|uniref:Lipoprotein n=1 Tax=Tsuneonella deserti TaxID=2035528 RepID=A0ABQ1S6D8_9SPHN|nr:hypothetical protein [Tsuneonella deserti]GGD92322.1 hypothetical protein GCM10011515_10020 [Tsuneonella deserti]